MIRRIGVVLGFQRQPVTLPVRLASGAVDRSIEEVAGIELDARLGRGDGQHAAAGGIAEDGGDDHRLVVGALAVEHEIVIVAAPELSCSLSSRMRSPMACGVVKSNGVSATGAISPVGISVASTGV